MHFLFALSLTLFHFFPAHAREGDPASLIENVSVISGNYSEHEIDVYLEGPDPLVFARSYDSRGSLSDVGGWSFSPHCFLRVIKAPHPRTYSTAVGTFELIQILVGTDTGSALAYTGWQNPHIKSAFKLDAEGLANTARQSISAWTNQKNNQLIFEDNQYELTTSIGGKKIYTPSSQNSGLYLLAQETLPSGNKIFYAYEGDFLAEIKMTNASEEKVISWIRFQYNTSIHLTTSDNQTVDYAFDKDSALLSEVIRSHKPALRYQYQIIDRLPLLIEKQLACGRPTKISYYMDGKVELITSHTASPVQYIYGDGFTQVSGASKKIYRFDEQSQLTAIEEFLEGGLFRVHRKEWGKKKDASNLLAVSLEDSNGAVYSSKKLTYDDQGNIVEEEERGNLTGTSLDESHTKTYSYQTSKDWDIISQKDVKGSGVKFYYKKGTNVLVKKLVLNKKNITKRWFYKYDEDGSLIQTIIDDGDGENLTSYDGFTERHSTIITPKQNLPNVGTPEIVEEKYFDTKRSKYVLLKKVINSFDDDGNVISSAVYDANGICRYTLEKNYHGGLLLSETDPIGHVTRYSYDTNQNLSSVHRANTSATYQYDPNNRLISVSEGDFAIHYTYDATGNKTSEIAPFGNKTLYTYDELGRTLSIAYSGDQSPYIYTYDLLDSVTSMTNPVGEITQQTHTVRGSPIRILYPDGTQELFKYDLEGSLHRYLGLDGIVKIFEYDYVGRLSHIEYYQRGSKGKNEGFKREYFQYNAFHLISHEDENEAKITYTYDEAGRLSSLIKDHQKKEFSYDALGRTHTTKKWKSAAAFTLEVREHDLLDRIIEERLEDKSGKVLFKTRCTYDPEGRLQEMISYPQNQENVLVKYQYDHHGRPCAIADAYGAVTTISYQDNQQITTDAKGTKTEEMLDPLGRVAKTIKRDRSGKLLFESTSSFDHLGNLTLEKTARISDGKVTGDCSTERSYAMGKLTRDEQGTLFSYDTYGNLSSIAVLGFDTSITLQYDREGNIASCDETELTYDKKGHLTGSRLPHATITYDITPNDQIASETIKDKFGSYQTKISYDGEGCITAMQLPDGSWIKYTYEGPFVSAISRQAKGKKELYTYRVVARDQMGNVLEEILPQHAGARKQVWDKAGRKIQIVTDFFSDRVDEWDPCHNIKKRTISSTGAKEYDYDAQHALIAETGTTYSYDALGNRLTKNSSPYEVNSLNQLFKAEEISFSFTPSGQMATKTSSGKTWEFQTNSLGHLTSLEDLSFSYDLDGKRLSKTIKGKTYRYFYLGETELGSLDEKGNILELKVPSDPNHPESAPAIAIELHGDYFIPICDIQGNIACLIDPDQRDIVESYNYSAFGEVVIFNEKGKAIASSAAINPWRYKGKRVDPETGLVYFGKRYYDPKIGRFLSPDPMGTIDGPNLYRFCRNNPLTFTDYFGLSAELNGDEFNQYFYGEYEPHCHCEHHRDCKRGGDIQNAIGGASLGSASFFMGLLNHFAEAGFLATADDFGFDRAFKADMHDAMQDSLSQLHGIWNEGLIAAINFDPQTEQSRFYEKGAYTGLIAFDILRGNIKDIRKGMVFFSRSSNTALSSIAQKLGLRDGLKIHTNEALKLAEQYLGPNYRSTGKGRYISFDGRRQVRMGDSDILGKHGGGPHMNFEILQPSLHKEGKMEIIENYHIFIED